MVIQCGQWTVRMSLCYLCNVLLPRFHACKRPFLRNVSPSRTRYIPIVPLATHRLLPSRVSLLSNATMRRLRRPDVPSRYSCRELELRYPVSFHCFALTAPERQAVSRDVVHSDSSHSEFLQGDSGPHRFPGYPHATLPSSQIPAGSTPPIAFADSTMRSPLTQTERLQQSTNFRGSTVMASVPTPYASCRPYGTTTQCSFPAGGQPLPGGSGYPPGINCIFLHIYGFYKSRYSGLILSRCAFCAFSWLHIFV